MMFSPIQLYFCAVEWVTTSKPSTLNPGSAWGSSGSDRVPYEVP